jgi:hypothetical protein
MQQRVAIEDAELGRGVSDVDGQKHCQYRLRKRVVKR